MESSLVQLLGLFLLLAAVINGQPDFRVDQPYTQKSLLLSKLDTNNADQIEGLNLECLINEGCIGGYGERVLLRFGTKIDNIGDGEYYAGHPPAQPGDVGPWHWDTCHKHWHFRGYAHYELRSAESGAVVNDNFTPVRHVVGRKNGFCLMDNRPVFPGGYCAETHTCCNQGINPGCSDIYSNNLDCQWIDITGVDRSAGNYTLSVEVNPGGENRVIREELNYHNNKAVVDVNLKDVFWIPLERIAVPPDAGTDCDAVLAEVAAGNPRLSDRGQYSLTCDDEWILWRTMNMNKGTDFMEFQVNVPDDVLSVKPLNDESVAYFLMTETEQCFNVEVYTHIGFRVTAPRGSDFVLELQTVAADPQGRFNCDTGALIHTAIVRLSDYVVPDGTYQNIYIPIDDFDSAAGGRLKRNVKAVVFSEFKHPDPADNHFIIENLHFRKVCSD